MKVLHDVVHLDSVSLNINSDEVTLGTVEKGRVFSGSPISSWVERLWSAASLPLADSRRSMGSPRLMHLVNTKMNMCLLDDSQLPESLRVIENIQFHRLCSISQHF